jgi:lipopolysaccharide/colanic/teichoic acid biosynthesis glycosyltransferase
MTSEGAAISESERVLGRIHLQPEIAEHAASSSADPVADDLHVVIDLRPRTDPVEADPRPYLDETANLLSAPVWQLRVKRALDIIGATIAILLFSPLFVITSLAVAITSPGPLLYVSERIGRHGVPFRFFKFRSMRMDADSWLTDLQDINEADGPIFKIREDPRITPIGKLMRKLSLDELPQLFHVLSGKMSLVGPRPPIPAEVEEYGDWEFQRLLAKPGLTCIWQVSGRSDVDFATWVEMDLEYIQNWSLGLELKLLAKTMPAVLSGRGAY